MIRRVSVVAIIGIAFFNLLTGTAILLTADYTIIPVLKWVQKLSESELDKYVGVWARLLLVSGLLLIFVTTILTYIGRPKTDQAN